MSSGKRILILCTGNSARSQMAEGLMRAAMQEAGEDCNVFSAGVEPGFVRPQAIAAMREIGIDISGQRSKSIDEFLGQEFDYVITVCDNANERCPIFPAKTKRVHWSFDDPATVIGSEDEKLTAFRRVRVEIAARIGGFVKDFCQ